MTTALASHLNKSLHRHQNPNNRLRLQCLREEQHGTAIKQLPMSGVPASVAAVREGKYPLSRPLNLVTKGAPQGLAKRFIDFSRSKAANDIIEGQFFVPLAH